MIRLGIVVEGATEREFVKHVLAVHLWRRQIDAKASVIGRGGGSVNVPRIASAMAELYRSFDYVTSLVDFYGFERKGDAGAEELEERIEERVKASIRTGWDARRVLPYVQRHEFEALLFTDVEVFSSIDVPPEGIQELRRAQAGFETPEHINDDHETAPSRRIQKAVPSYDKVEHGPLLASEIGLDKVRVACPRFGAWLSRLEALGA